MSTTPERPGVVHLRDLDGWGAWDPPRTPAFVAASGLGALAPGGERRQRFAAPRVVLAVVDTDGLHLVRRCRAWLEGAEHVVLVREPGRVDAGADEEAVALEEEEWRTAVASITVHVELFEGAAADVVPAALLRAHDLAAALPPRPDLVAPVASDLELPVSSWIAHDLPRYARVGALVARLRLADGLLLVDAGAGRFVDLAAPAPAIAFSSPAASTSSTEEGRALHVARPGRSDLGADPVHPVAWRGDRMRFYWFLKSHAGEAFLASNEHDFPCGPAKKLWGHADNDPVQVHLAPGADFVVARFEHDVLLTGAVPVVWERAGAFDVAVFAPDPRRAVLFAQSPEEPRVPPTFDLLDEDARELAPVVVPGPTAAARYAVDLSCVVYRIERTPELGARQTNAHVTQVGGPDGGFAVFDAGHEPIRRARGRLLGGSYRWATVEDDGWYHREDIATGARTRLAPVDMRVADDPADEAVARDAVLERRYDVARELHLARPAHAVEEVETIAIPGTRNVLLVGAGYFRVV